MKKIQSNWVRIFLVGALLILFYRITENYEDTVKSVKNFIGIFTPCIIGIVIALFLWRPAEKLENAFSKVKHSFFTKHKKALSVIIIYILIIAILAIGVNFILPGIIQNLKDLAVNAPSYIEKLDGFLKENEYLSEIDFFENLNNKLSTFIREKLTLAKINKYVSVISGVASSFISFFLGVVFSVYILLEREEIKKAGRVFCEKVIHGAKGDILKRYVSKTVGLFYSYFAGLALDALIIGIVTALVLGIFNVPYAVLFGVFAAIGNMIPFFGPIVASVLTFIISTVTVGPVNALWILLFQLILGQIDSNLIQPKILSRSTGVSPLLVLFSVIVLGDMFGFAGMVLGVPLMAVIKMLVTDYFDNGVLDASTSEL